MWRASRVPKGTALHLSKRQHLQKSIYRDSFAATSSSRLLREDPPPPRERTGNARRRRRLPTAATASLSTAVHSTSLERLMVTTGHSHYEQTSFVETQRAMKSLVDTLLFTQKLVPPPVQPSGDPWLRYFADLGTTARTEPPEQESNNNNTDLALQQSLEATQSEPTQQDYPIETDPETTASVTDAATVATQPSEAKRRVHPNQNVHSVRQREGELVRFIRQKDPQRAMNVFNFAYRNGQADQLNPEIIKALFYLVSRRRSFDAYRVLKHFQKITAPTTSSEIDLNSYSGMYERVCDSIRYLNPVKSRTDQIQNVVRVVVAEAQKLNDASKRRCYPVLLSALCEQKSVQVGRFAPIIYQYMLEHDFEMTGGYLEHLLSLSKYFRQGDLPFADILAKAVDMGHRPVPYTALHVLENLYPYTDITSTGKALKAIVDLQSVSRERNDLHYVLDISSLEVIGSAATNAGSVELNLLIWDLIDLYGFEPTEGIYENTVIAFASSPDTYENAFAVLAEMETKGFEPSRALVRGLSTRMRQSEKYLDYAFDQVKALRQKGTHTSTAMLNAIMSGSAERGDIGRTVALMEEYPRNDVEPNADTFSFALEALGKNLYRRTVHKPSESYMLSVLKQADSLLSRMEEMDIAPTHNIIREYVELLCQTGEVKTATDVVLENLDNGLVNSKTIYRLAIANVERMNFDIARTLAVSGNEPLPVLIDIIDEAQRKAQKADQSASVLVNDEGAVKRPSADLNDAQD